MGFDVYSGEDVRDALMAANEANGQTLAIMAGMVEGSQSVAILRAYREGYKAALCVVALAFGIAPQSIRLPGSDLTFLP